jgi:hypothetical protein
VEQTGIEKNIEAKIVMPLFLKNFLKHPNSPVILLIVVNIVIGSLIFRDYGLTLDEPLYYGYGDAIGYAYSPRQWFSGNFNLENAFGPSASDHQNRGPAYLLLARGPAHFLEWLGVDYASAWHLVNFLSFQIGIYFFFLLCKRWMKNWAAFAATLLFATQPLLWGHAFINPKDPQFMVAFLASLELGFRMAERLANPQPNETKFKTFLHILLPAVVLGIATNLRVLGPLAGLLAFIYFLSLRKPARWYWYVPYGLIAFLTFFAAFPFLWKDPLKNLINILLFFSDNPTELRVLFMGQIYTANKLPLRYLPTLLLVNLTEPVWPLATSGLIIAILRARIKAIDWRTLVPTLLWFVIPILYVLIRRPAMYDGFRHSLFILPPIFALAGIGLDWVFERLSNLSFRVALTALLILPAVWANIQLHPYEYAYFNQFVGGTGKAASRFETDYWSTCIKEAMDEFNAAAPDEAVLYNGLKSLSLTKYYASDRINIKPYRQRQNINAGEYILHISRANPTLQSYRNSNDNLIKIERDSALFCVIRKSK